MNEYVHINYILHNRGVWTTEYEPLDHIPVIEGSLTGTIYNGLMPRGFEVLNNGQVVGMVPGVLLKDSGILVLCYYDEPNPDNYLRVSYEAGYREIEELTKSFWLQEGF